MRRLKMTGLLLMLALAWVSQPLMAAEEEGGVIARGWSITPKAGSAEAFNKALKAHAQWRRDNDDPWQWNFYRAQSGDMDGTVFIRSGSHTNADIDAYAASEFSAKAGAHWNQTVQPYVGHASSSFSRRDKEMFDWPEGDYRVFWVTNFHLRPGHALGFTAEVKKINAALKAAGRQSTHSWSWAMTGEHIPTAMLVTARANWAGFDSPEQSVREALATQMSEMEVASLMDAAFSHVKSMSSRIYISTDEFSGK
ncbi:MAG: hypothetical protein MUP90_15415 [Gammaproteobacteria bacterium]|nr:hypothetical protein [Gammaproteobacteria bacterium]